MTLHIYGQEAWHDTVQIVGTSDALRSLRDTLSQIVDGHATDSVATFFTNDGEGYAVTIRLETATALEGSCVPYTAEYARDPQRVSTNLHWPRKALEGGRDAGTA